MIALVYSCFCQVNVGDKKTNMRTNIQATFLFGVLIIFLFSGCKKACYACSAFIIHPNKIDTFMMYGQPRYDTTGGGYTDSAWTFTSCEINKKYHYGNYTIVPSLKADTIIDCQQWN